MPEPLEASRVSPVATCLGFPRGGEQSELKAALASFLSGTIARRALEELGCELRRRHWSAMKAAGMTEVPTNDFSFYDHVLDTAVLLGAIPLRYEAVADSLSRYFAMARGFQDVKGGLDLPPLEKARWFDTGYHHVVPELASLQTFALDPSRVLREIEEARSLGVAPRPVIVGPVTFLKLSKLASDAPSGASALPLLDQVLCAYEELLASLADQVGWIQLDEPCLTQELDAPTAEAYRRAYLRLAGAKRRPKILLATYFGDLRPNLELVHGLGCDGLHVDLIRGPDELPAVLDRLDGKTVLSLGIVDGRNVWSTDLPQAIATMAVAMGSLGGDRLRISSSCSLLHVPFDLPIETDMVPEFRSLLAFAKEKLAEIGTLARIAGEGDRCREPFAKAAE